MFKSLTPDTDHTTELKKMESTNIQAENELFAERTKRFSGNAMNQEELLSFLKDALDWLKAQDQFEKEGVLTRLKFFQHAYRHYRSSRREVGDAISDGGWAALVVKMTKYFNEKGYFTTDMAWSPECHLIYSLGLDFSDASKELAKSMAEGGILELLLENAANKKYLENLKSDGVMRLVVLSVETLHNLAQVPEVKHLFREHNAIEVLKPFMTSSDDSLQAASCMAVAHIVDESENHILSEAGCIKNITRWLARALAKRETRRYRGYSAIELVDGLAYLAVNDQNKQRIVDAGVLPSLTDMMKSNDEAEQCIAARCVWTLSFDQQTRVKIQKDKGCMEALQKLSKSSNAEVRKNAKGALWQINELELKQSEESKKKTSSKEKHIFISYNHTHQVDVKEVADKLMADGYRVWMDIYEMSGDMLEAMASAIQNSEAMIICMSEKYKLSPDCQSEVQYARRLRIPIIPLMVQRYYKPDGWLGFVLGAKLYINFDGKFPFEEAYHKLIKELQSAVGKGIAGPVLDHVAGMVQAQTASGVGSAPASAPKSQVREWTQEQVTKWLTRSNLQHHKDNFKGYDGKLLLGMYKVSNKAPEYFFSSMGTLLKNPMDVMLLAEALDNL